MTVRRAWESWRARPFPKGVAGAEIEGVDVTTVDAFAAGCIQTYVDRGHLDAERHRVLVECVGDLDRVLPSLSGESARYFTELRDLGQLVLEELARGSR